MTIREFHERMHTERERRDEDPRIEALRSLIELDDPETVRPRGDSRICWPPWTS